MTAALLLALAGTAQADDVGVALSMVGVRSSNGHRPLHRGLTGWYRKEIDRPFDLEAELVWATAREEFIGVDIRTHLVRPAFSVSWSTGTRRAQVSASVGACLSLYAGGVDGLVLQARPGLKSRIGVDVPWRDHWQVRWHFGLASRGLTADVETGLGLGRVL